MKRGNSKSQKGGQALAHERKMGRHEWRKHGRLDARVRQFTADDSATNAPAGLQLHKPGSAKK